MRRALSGAQEKQRVAEAGARPDGTSALRPSATASRLTILESVSEPLRNSASFGAPRLLFLRNWQCALPDNARTMSQPRPVLPGRVYLITRRCSERRFFMRPDWPTTEAFRYCLLVAAARFGIELVGFLANINNWQGVILDRFGRYPEFLHLFHLLFAKHQNALRRRRENFWSSEQTSVVELLDGDTIADKIAYVLATPAKDHFVESATSWPGASSLAALRDRTMIRANRPSVYFPENSTMPKSISVALSPPPGFASLGDLWQAVEPRIAAIEAAATVERARLGRRALGAHNIIVRDWHARPSSVERDQDVSSRFAAKSTVTRDQAVRKRREWLKAYRASRQRLAVRSHVEFPAGTFALARLFRVRAVAAAPS